MGYRFFSFYSIYFTLLIPRSTYGYYPIDKIIFSTINTLANFGSFQHFIHPDDFFAKDRNPSQKDWKELLENLNKFYYIIKTKFPWLKNHTASEAYPYFLDFLSENYEYKITEKTLKVTIPNTVIMPKYFLLKTKFPIKQIIDGKIIAFYLQNVIYIIEMNSTRMTIEFLR